MASLTPSSSSNRLSRIRLGYSVFQKRTPELTIHTMIIIYYTIFMIGKCPNTGEACAKLEESSAIRRAHIDASPTPFLPGASNGLNTAELAAYNRNLREGLNAIELRGTAEESSCIGGCALANVDVPAFISR